MEIDMERAKGKSMGFLLIAHGSRQPMANEDLHSMAAGLTGRGYKIVEPCFLELAEPDVMEGGRRCVEKGAGTVVLLPYFLSAGVHVAQDLARLRDDLKRTFPSAVFLLAKPLGPHPLLESLLEARLLEALGCQASGKEAERENMESSSSMS